MGFFFIIIITSKHFQTVDNNKTPIFFQLLPVWSMWSTYSCVRSRATLGSQINWGALLIFFCHVNLSRPFGLLKDEEGGEKMEVGWVDYDRNEKKKKEKKNRLKEEKKEKTLQYMKQMKTKTNMSLMDNLHPADIFINYSNSIIVFLIFRLVSMQLNRTVTGRSQGKLLLR